MDAAWPRCLERLEAELPADEVHTWLRPLQAGACPAGLTRSPPNEFVVAQGRQRSLERIRELTAPYAGRPASVGLAVGSAGRAEAPAAPARAATPAPAAPFQGNLDPHYTFAN